MRAQIAEAQKIANGSGSDQDIAEAKIELEVCFPCHQNMGQLAFVSFVLASVGC